MTPAPIMLIMRVAHVPKATAESIHAVMTLNEQVALEIASKVDDIIQTAKERLKVTTERDE